MPELLKIYPALERKDLLAAPVLAALEAWAGKVPASAFEVAEIDPDFSDTEAFCEHYAMAPQNTANTVIVEAKRAGESQFAVVVMSAARRADLNGVVRRALNARRLSLAPKEAAVNGSRMEYGSITAVGLPADWPVLVDARLLEVPRLLMGGGLRRSKLLFPGRALGDLPGAMVLTNITKD